MSEDLTVLRDAVMEKLKAFQRATVKRIDRVYRDREHPQKRVLVADEVGLGKTLIAKGVISNMAVLREEEGDDLFKVIYVCSNQTIARQNIEKLRISKENSIDNLVDETRLSMQHLRVLEQERECKKKDVFIQLIPLTPGTSFQITNSQGSARERALMSCILELRSAESEALSDFLRCNVGREKWENARDVFRKRIERVRETAPDYPESLIRRMDGALLEELEQFLAGWDGKAPNRGLIVKLRRMFAELSAEMLQPDLVIMDEFQRFHSLLNPEDDDDLRTLTEKFLRCGSETEKRPRILLLSATPYKLYSTLDEIDETQCDEHYREFMEVIDFLLEHDPVRMENFKSVWQEYSRQLCELKRKAAVKAEAKQKAEDELYASGMCRTERISFVKEGDFLVSHPEMLEPDRSDVLAYTELCRILKKLKLPDRIPYDFAKSSPYLLSFMDQYKLKQDIESRLTSESAKEIVRGRGKRSLVWLRRDFIDKYEMLPACHAKLECLRKYAFEHHAERLLWIPPSMPNYEPAGVFKEAEDFSKILIFSAWEMVPRMVSVLISYDAECRTNGKLCRERYKALQETGTRRGMDTLHYFKSGRFPQKRLFSVRDKKEKKELDRLAPQAEFLRIRSGFLINCFSPSGQRFPLREVRAEVLEKIKAKLGGIKEVFCCDGENILIALLRCLDDESISLSAEGEMQKVPAEALRILTDMAIAAPGICVVRSLQHYFPDADETEVREAAESITERLLRMFDSPEGVGAVAKSCADLEDYERKVLQYCVDGNFQAMFDEYCFLQKTETDGDLSAAVRNICGALDIRAATYDVQTWESTVQSQEKSPLKMRSHYAVGFNKSTKGRGDADSQETADRKDSIRTAFNSPFRPFVLTSTSAGQEGLDFHLYCRRIMHWNLPHNPTELEQRDGRINRYLCLAIRNSMARAFSKPEYCRDWDGLLAEAAKEAEKNNDPYSEISPYWCFSKNQPVKIERIVPMYPFSRDVIVYKRLQKLLSLYRLTMGQARQEELLDAVLAENPDVDRLTRELFISLCPFQKDLQGEADRRPR